MESVVPTGRCFVADSGEKVSMCVWKLAADAGSEPRIERFAAKGCPTATLSMLHTAKPSQKVALDGPRVLVAFWVPRKVPRRDLVRVNMHHFGVSQWDVALASQEYWPEEPWWSHVVGGKTTQYFQGFADKWAFAEYLLSKHEGYDYVFIPDWSLVYTPVGLRAFALDASRTSDNVAHIVPTMCSSSNSDAIIAAAPLIRISFFADLVASDSCTPLDSRHVTGVGSPVYCESNNPKTNGATSTDPHQAPCIRPWSQCWPQLTCTLKDPKGNAPSEFAPFAVPQPAAVFSQLALFVGTPNKQRVADILSDGPSRLTLQRLWNVTVYMPHSRQVDFSNSKCPSMSFSETATDAKRPTPPRPQWKNPKPRRKNVAIIAVGADRLDLLRVNAYHFMEHDFDMILGHYDMKMDAFLREPWYTEDLVVLAKEKRYRGKFNFWEDIYDNHRSLMEQYNYVLLPDADFMWRTVDLTCYVKNANGFGLVGPAVVGYHRATEQDPLLVKKNKKCPVRTVNDVEVQAPMFPRKSLKKLKDLLLPENHDKQGELETCWCLDHTWCRYIGSCGLYEICGNPVHCNTHTLNKKDSKWIQATTRNCRNMRRRFRNFMWRNEVDMKRLPNKFRCYNSTEEAARAR